MGSELDYITRCPKCNGINSAIAGDSERKRLTKDVADLIRKGLSIERISSDGIRNGTWCSCHRAKRESKQLGLKGIQ